MRHEVLACTRNILKPTIYYAHFLWVKSALIRSFYGYYSVQMQENDDQKDSEYGHFSRSVYCLLNYFLQGSVAVNNYKTKTYLKYSIFKPYLFIYLFIYFFFM